MSIRALVPSDHAAVEALLREGLRDQEAHAAIASPPEDEGFFAAEFQEHMRGLADRPAEWRVAEAEDGTILGCLWLKSEIDRLGPYRSVRQIIVSGAWRDQGWGTALLRQAVEETRASDAVMLLISGYKTNPALRLYERVGFEPMPSELRRDRNPNAVVLWMPSERED